MNGNGSEQVNINIEKRNGAHEAFDEEKLARGVSRSGTPFMMAKDIAKSIQKKIKEIIVITILSALVKSRNL